MKKFNVKISCDYTAKKIPNASFILFVGEPDLSSELSTMFVPWVKEGRPSPSSRQGFVQRLN